MPRLGRHAAALGMALVAWLPACDLAADVTSRCPLTVDEAAETDWGDAVVGGGYAIRFVPSPQLRFRGYDVNLTRPVSDRAMLDTYFLRVEDEIPGIAAGDPVLLVGARTDRAHTLVAGACPALTVTTEEDVSLERN